MRRVIWAVCAALVLAGGCAKSPVGKAAVTMKALADGTLQEYSLSLPPEPDLIKGSNRLVFALLNKQQSFVPNRNLEIFFGREKDGPAAGPVRVVFEDDGLGDRAFYRANITFPMPGRYLLLAAENSGGKRRGAGTEVTVKESSSLLRAGDKAISIATPTQADHNGLADICTRDPEDPMHDLSLDFALKNGKPTVVVFATPALCASRVCGPVVDQVLRVREAFVDRANFIHVEVFTDNTGKDLTAGMKAWSLLTEPWTFVIDTKGVIRGRFEGPVTTTEIKTALGEVL